MKTTIEIGRGSVEVDGTPAEVAELLYRIDSQVKAMAKQPKVAEETPIQKRTHICWKQIIGEHISLFVQPEVANMPDCTQRSIREATIEACRRMRTEKWLRITSDIRRRIAGTVRTCYWHRHVGD